MNKHHKEERLWCFSRWSRKSWSTFASLRRLKIGRLSVAMSIILLATQVAGAQTAGTDSLAQYRTLHLDTLQVGGSKMNPARTVMSQTRLYDRDTDGAAPLETLESVLRLSPSVDLRERGGKGIQADISIRGGSFDQTMVMLNGINFSDARTGHQSHSLPVDPDCIATVGLMDGVTGVGALAGAVNVIARPLYPAYLRAHIAGGRWGYAYGNLSGAYTHDRLTVFSAASYRRSDGYRHNTDFRNVNAYSRLMWDSRRAGFFDVQGGFQTRSWGANGFYSLAFPDQFEKTRTGLVSARWYNRWGRFALSASASYRKNLDRFELQRGNPDNVPFNHHNTDNAGAEMWGDLGWRLGTTSLGADWMFNHILSTALGEPVAEPSRPICGADGYYTRAKGRHTVNAWMRHVKRWRRFDAAAQGGVSSTPYGTAGMWSAAFGWMPFEGFRAEAGASRSMRLPTFTELYYNVGGYHPDPGLNPEKATAYRLSASYFRSGWDAAATVYYRRSRDVIDWQQRADGEWYSTQLTRLGTAGAEISGRYVSGGWLRTASLGYGYVHTGKNVPPDYISKYALDYMRHKVSAIVGVGFMRDFTFTLTGSFYDRTGEYIDAAGVKHGFEPYFLLDCHLAWERGWIRLYADVTNITDTRYFDFGGLPMPGPWASAGIVVTLK